MGRLVREIPYDPDFLGDGYSVPLPGFQSNDAGVALRAQLLNGGRPFHYTYFSLVMHQERRQALFTACNIDGDQQKQVTRTDWNLDLRDGVRDFQIGNEAYRDNDWDRGHLVRRQDVCWGTRREAKEASDSTFFYTNSALQHHNFNGDEWNQLEDWVLERVAAAAPRLCVLTGQFLHDQDLHEEVNPDVFVQIPNAFWKIIVLRDPTANGEDLTAAAFVIPQTEHFIESISGQAGLPPLDLEVYQVAVSDLEQMTGLDFGELRNADDFPWSVVRFRADRPEISWKRISESEDIILGGERRRRAGGRILPRYQAGNGSRPGGGSNAIHVGSTSPGAERAASHHGDGGEADGGCGCEGGGDNLTARVAVLARQVEQIALALETYGLQELAAAEQAANPEDPRNRGRIMDELFRIAATERADALINVARRIRGGVPVVRGEFPSCVVIGNESQFFCTGVLIHPRMVLTAAHCVPPGISRVLAGTISTAEAETLDDAQMIPVTRVVRNHQYGSAYPNHDIAIVILAEAAELSAAVAMAEIVDETEFADAGEASIVGFGNTNAAGTAGFGRKRKAVVPIQPMDGLSADQVRDVERRFGFGNTHEFRAGGENLGIDTCTGDSGGPAYVMDADGAGAFKLAGLTSRAARQGDEACGDSGIYTKVYPYLPWINQIRAQFNL